MSSGTITQIRLPDRVGEIRGDDGRRYPFHPASMSPSTQFESLRVGQRVVFSVVRVGKTSGAVLIAEASTAPLHAARERVDAPRRPR